MSPQVHSLGAAPRPSERKAERMTSVDSAIEEFWNKLDESTKRELRDGDPVLFIGNGITRLADSEAADRPVSWRGWVEDSWRTVNPPTSFDYVLRRGLTLPECLSYLLAHAGEHKELIYKNLWKATEIESRPGRVHFSCVDHFTTIVTTNYDTLLERACQLTRRRVNSVVVGAAVDMGKWPLDWKDLLKATRPDARNIVKLHGSFATWTPPGPNARPPDGVFDKWYRARHGDDLIASVRAYRGRHSSVSIAVKEIGEVLHGRPIVVLGYGMSPEDDLVIDLIEKYIEPVIRIGMTYGGDEIDDHRFKSQWGITHLLIPAVRGGGMTERRRSHINLIAKLRNGEPEQISFESHRALLIGQASVNYVVRLQTSPKRELSYAIDMGPSSLSLVPGEVGGSPKMPPADSIDYEIKQVGGQMLIPALFLSRWQLPVSLASVVGQDKFGLEIREDLARHDYIDWSYVIQPPDIRTEHSYATTFANSRIMVDSRRVALPPKATSELSQRILTDLDDGTLKPRLVYLSRWYLAEAVEILVPWLAGCRVDEQPLVAFETGNWGSRNPDLVASIAGSLCDIVLSSAIFAMRLTRMPLYSPQQKDVAFDKSDADIETWDNLFNAFEPQNLDSRAYQYQAFGYGLEALGLDGFAERLRNSALAHVEWFVVTLGEVGMLALHRDNPADAFWVRCPAYRLLNSAGCGDVARAGFIASFMKDRVRAKDFLDSPALVKNAICHAVAAGSRKGLYFLLRDALDALGWDTIDGDATRLKAEETFDLRQSGNFGEMIRALKGSTG